MFYLVSEDELEKFLWQLSKSLKPFFNILFWASRQLGIIFSHPQPSKSKIELNSGSNHRFQIQTRIIFMKISFKGTIFKTKNISWSCIQITQRMFQQNKIVFFLYLYPQCLLFGNVPQKFSIFRQDVCMIQYVVLSACLQHLASRSKLCNALTTNTIGPFFNICPSKTEI